MSAGRLSVEQQVHHQEAPAGGAVHVSCPPLQAGNSMKQPLCAVRPVIQPRTQPGPASNTHTHTHTRTHTHTKALGLRQRQPCCRRVTNGCWRVTGSCWGVTDIWGCSNLVSCEAGRRPVAEVTDGGWRTPPVTTTRWWQWRRGFMQRIAVTTHPRAFLSQVGQRPFYSLFDMRLLQPRRFQWPEVPPHAPQPPALFLSELPRAPASSGSGGRHDRSRHT